MADRRAATSTRTRRLAEMDRGREEGRGAALAQCSRSPFFPPPFTPLPLLSAHFDVAFTLHLDLSKKREE